MPISRLQAASRLLTPPLAALLTLFAAQTKAESLEGVLEHGPQHSVLWDVSPESGDLIGQVFGNQSPAGRLILGQCLPELPCQVRGARTSEPSMALQDQLAFESQPSGWWQIDHVTEAHMVSNFADAQTQLNTRFGTLRINDEQQLTWQNQVVMAPVPTPQTEHVASHAPHTPASEAAHAHTPSTTPTEGGSWWSRLNQQLKTWLATLSQMVQSDLQALRAWLGMASAETMPSPAQDTAQPADTASPAPTRHAKQPTTAPALEAVGGNVLLAVVAHFELEDKDLVVLQNTGGTACPALYRFLTLTAQGIALTPEFGTCSDLAATGLPPATFAGADLALNMPGQTDSGQMFLQRYVLQHGQVHAMPAR